MLFIGFLLGLTSCGKAKRSTGMAGDLKITDWGYVIPATSLYDLGGVPLSQCERGVKRHLEMSS